MFELALNLAAMFFAYMVCHGELARLKPNPRHLTEFYLMIAAGGALGGLFVAIVAPLVFSTYFEWQIGVVASALLAVGLLVLPGRAGRRGVIYYSALSPLAAIGLSSFFFWGFDPVPPIDRTRNFFGVVTVKEDVATVTKEGAESDDAESKESIREFVLENGRILHGRQAADPANRHWPTSYYGESSGVGRAICFLQKSGPVRVGAIGLGVGTLAAYAKPGDVFRFYEINPEVERMAKQYFTYLADCRGKWDIVLADARLSLESEPPQKFDLIVLDAFSGDAIPTHLLTREAFDVYQRHLVPGGVIAVHISNGYLRLAPVVRRLAENCGMRVSRIDDTGVESRLQSISSWALATRNGAFLKANPSDPLDWGDDDRAAPLWTDQYSNLFQILKGPQQEPAFRSPHGRFDRH
jgi:spermidine synthase